jgi:hypothetical protein
MNKLKLKGAFAFLMLMTIRIFVNEITVDFSCLFEHQYKRLCTKMRDDL